VRQEIPGLVHQLDGRLRIGHAHMDVQAENQQ
jgi:hypothetical protein